MRISLFALRYHPFGRQQGMRTGESCKSSPVIVSDRRGMRLTGPEYAGDGRRAVATGNSSSFFSQFPRSRQGTLRPVKRDTSWDSGLSGRRFRQRYLPDQSEGGRDAADMRSWAGRCISRHRHFFIFSVFAANN